MSGYKQKTFESKTCELECPAEDDNLVIIDIMEMWWNDKC